MEVVTSTLHRKGIPDPFSIPSREKYDRNVPRVLFLPPSVATWPLLSSLQPPILCTRCYCPLLLPTGSLLTTTSTEIEAEKALASARTDHWQPRPLLPRAGSGGEGVSKIWWNGYGICLRYLEEVLGRSMFHQWHKMRNTLIYISFVLIWIGQARSFYCFLFLSV